MVTTRVQARRALVSSSQVFNTPELVEPIFSHLDFYSLLTLQKLNRTTYDVVQHTRQFRLALCLSLDPAPPADPKQVVNNHVNPLCMPVSRHQYRYRPVEHYGSYSHWCLQKMPARKAWLRKDASWQRMFAHRRPMISFHLRVDLRYPDSGGHRRTWRVVSSFTPGDSLRLSTINDLVNGWCSSSRRSKSFETWEFINVANSMYLDEPSRVAVVNPLPATYNDEEGCRFIEGEDLASSGNEVPAFDYESRIVFHGLLTCLILKYEVGRSTGMTLSRTGHSISDEPDELATQMLAALGTLPGMTVRKTPLTKPGFEIVLPARFEDVEAPPKQEPEGTSVSSTSSTA